MKRSEFINMLTKIQEIATKHKWQYKSNDINTFRVSFGDEFGIYRLDVYLSKMTICLLPAEGKPVYFKKKNLSMVEDIMKNPYKYEKP